MQVGWLLCRRVFVSDPVFGGLDRNTQKLIAANMTPLHLLPGHTLCQQGAVADRVWLLQEGTGLGVLQLADIALHDCCSASSKKHAGTVIAGPAWQ